MSDRFSQGDHVCVAYDSAEEQLDVAVTFIADGLRRNERCLYAADSRHGLDAFRAALASAGVDAAAAEESGSLLLLTKDLAHLQQGRFDCERMLQMLNDSVEAALNAGYIGLRTCGDMSWLLDNAPGTEQIVEYEALLNQFFSSVRALGMCQYDRTRLPQGLLDHALETHPSLVLDRRHRANPFYRSSWSAAASETQPAGFEAKMAALRSGTV